MKAASLGDAAFVCSGVTKERVAKVSLSSTLRSQDFAGLEVDCKTY